MTEATNTHTASAESAHGADGLKTAFLRNMTDRMVHPVEVIASAASIINEEHSYFSQQEMTLFVDKMLANTKLVTELLKELLAKTNHADDTYTSTPQSETDRKVTAFIQDLTHQIRTPLNIVVGFAQVLRDDYNFLSPAELKDIAQNMHQSSMDITRIVDMLVAAARLETDTDIELADHIGCNYICREATADITLLRPGSVGLHVNSSVPDSLRIRTDKNSVVGILRELLLNANKFTLQGNIILAVDHPHPSSVVFSVSDTGPGIPHCEHENVFAHFTKLDSFSDGLGLGLTVCRQMARMLGGELAIDPTYHWTPPTEKGARPTHQSSRPKIGPGTRFTLTLPLGVA